MKIAVTGVTGQVGREIVSLLQSEHEVAALDRAALDLTDSSAIEDCIARLQPDCFINCAAYTQVDAAEKDEATAFALNADAPRTIANACRRAGARLIHFSTDYVFDGHSTVPYRESDPTDPINVYGRSKLAGEQAIESCGGDYLILRASWIYGMHGHNFLRTMLRLGSEREILRVVNDQVGSPTWARSLAEATQRIVQRRTVPSGIYHLSSGGQTSWHGFATEIFRHVPPERRRVREIVPISTQQYPTPAARPAYSVLNTGKFQAAFGFNLPEWKADLERMFAGER